MTLSIIIPLYNCEPYILRCLNSIYSQCLDEKSFEVIIVNDGSTDSGPNIVEDYKKKRTNILLIHQQNGGISVARNKGLEYASGEYIYFVDADDMLIENVLPALVDISIENKLDILDFLSQNEDPKTHFDNVKFRDNPFDGTVYSGPEYYGSHKTYNGVWSYFIRRQFIEENYLRFIVGKISEDAMFSVAAYVKAKRVAHLEKDVYLYMCNPTSTLRKNDREHRLKVARDFKFVAEYLLHLRDSVQNDISNLCKKQIESRANSFLFFMFVRLLKIPNTSDEIISISKELENKGMYPFPRMSNIEYPGLVYTILWKSMNHKWLWCFLNRLYSLSFFHG